jgi:predicted DNA-binding protein (MmcQ/YjbR family)
MDLDTLRDYCLSLPETEEKTPFDEETLVFYVAGKIFCLTNINRFESINVKCDPARALELREEYPGVVLPGYHMNKKHWNTVRLAEGVRSETVLAWVRDSYDLVVAGLPKVRREALQGINGA